MCIYCNFHPSFSTFAGLPRPASDDYQYSSDYDNYDNEPIPNEEEETEINYDIKFMKPGKTLVVDKGTTIKLPCNVDKYPRKIENSKFINKKRTLKIRNTPSKFKAGKNACDF